MPVIYKNLVRFGGSPTLPGEIVQTTGTSTANIMSQNAVTSALSSKADSSSVYTTSQTYTKTEVNSLNGAKVNTAQGSSAKGNIMMCDATGNIYPLGTDIAALHNTIWRGANLSQWFTKETFLAAIASGDFSNIYVGDYFPGDSFSTTSAGSVSSPKYYVAHIKGMTNYGSSTINANNVIMTLHAGYAGMNATNTTVGAYVGSNMHTTVLPEVQTQVENFWGSSRVATTTHLFADTMNSSTASMAGAGFTGASTCVGTGSGDWGWTSTKLWLPNEINVYGSKVWSSSAYDCMDMPWQLPFYRGKSYLQTFGRGSFWLSAVASSSTFALAHYYGFAGYSNASVAHAVRPLFALI